MAGATLVKGSMWQMNADVSLEKIYVPSEDIVAREIEGSVIIVPLVAGIGDTGDELYTLNETGQAVWKLMDGTKTLGQVAEDLSEEFEGEEIVQDVLGFVSELVKRRIVVETT